MTTQTKKAKAKEKPTELECKVRARSKYEAKRERKTVSFNGEMAEDVAMLKFVETIDFSPWVKNALRAELDKRKAHG